MLRLLRSCLGDGLIDVEEADRLDEEIQGTVRAAAAAARAAAMPPGELATVHSLAPNSLWPPVRTA